MFNQMMKKMKSFFCGILSFAVTMGAFVTTNAETMCVRDDTVMVVLDETTFTGTYAGNSNNMTWTATFPYGKISGIASCNGTGGVGMYAVSNTEFATTITGSHCWCKMLKPVASKWQYQGSLVSISNCKSNCAGLCGSRTGPESGLTSRSNLFGSIGQ